MNRATALLESQFTEDSFKKSTADAFQELMLSMLPQDKDEQMKKILEYIEPIVKQLSPTWGDKIVEILKQLDASALLSLAKNNEELKETVKQKEAKLKLKG